MTPIAKPLADEQVSKHISAELSKLDKPTSGIKACTKDIRNNKPDVLLVLSATTAPLDLISHMPVLCEERNTPYIFVPDNSWIKGYTCVLLPTTDSSAEMGVILSAAQLGPADSM